MSENNIVLTGIAGRFPEADDIDELWTQLLEGKILYTEDRGRHPKKLRHKPTALGQIKDMTKFDYEFFRYPEKESELVGAQTRILHEVVYEALWDAGIRPETLKGSKTGFFLGISVGDGIDLYDMEVKADPTYIFARIPYHFDWNGPCFSIDTACASTLDALIQAHWHIKQGLCDIAVVAGVNTIIDPFVNVTAADMKMLSTSGFERCLDEHADGFIRSETIAALVLQSKSSAKRIYGEILGTSVNNDGYTEEGITFPNRKAQADAMRKALKVARIDPLQIDYIEAHITGTQAGDAVETSAILDAYRQDSNSLIRLGCIKSNIGHGEATAGINAVARACKILQTGYLSPNACYETPNSRITGLIEGKIIPVLEKVKFDRGLLGVNTFGFGGSNGHIILKDNPKRITHLSQTPRLTLFCNRTQAGIDKMVEYFKSNQISEDFLTLVNELAQTCPEGGMICRAYGIIGHDNSFQFQSRIVHESKKICLVFGESSQLEASGLTKMEILRQSLESNASYLASKGFDLSSILNKKPRKINNSELDPALVSYHIAVTDLLQIVGIKPDLVIGHSVGKISAKYACGQIKRESALDLSLHQRSGKLNDSTEQNKSHQVNPAINFFTTIKNGYPSLKFLKNSGEYFAQFLTSSNMLSDKESDWLIITIDGDTNVMDQNREERSTANNSLNHILEVLGHLYLAGHNIALDKIYPTIKYPIGRECPSISPFLQWDHSNKFEWSTMNDFYENMTNITYTVDLSDPEYEEVAHHIFEDRVIMPAVGYLYLLWKNMVFTEYGDSKNFLDYGFRVWDIRIHRATIIKDSATFKVYYNPSTKKFAVAHREQVCVSGFGEILKNSKTDFESLMKTDLNPEIIESDGDRFYLGLKIQGFHYGPKMRNVASTAADHTYGRIKYTKGWIGLADAFIQMGGLSTALRTPRVPVALQEFVYEPEALKESIEMFSDEENPELEVFVCKELATITTYGVMLRGLQFGGAPQKPEQSDLRYARQVFRPLDHEIELKPSLDKNILTYLTACQELLTSSDQNESKEEWSMYVKNENRYKIFNWVRKFLEYRREKEESKLSELLRERSSVFGRDFLMNSILQQTFSSIMNVYEGELSKKLVTVKALGIDPDDMANLAVKHLAKFAVRGEIVKNTVIKTKRDNEESCKSTIKPSDLLIYQHESVAFCQAEEASNIEEELDAVEPGKFAIVVLREKILSLEEMIQRQTGGGQSSTNHESDIVEVFSKHKFLRIASCRHKDSGLITLLFKKSLIPPQLSQSKVIKVDSMSYNWVDDVQEAMDDKDIERVWLIANDSHRNGILGLVKCLRFEPFGDKIRSIFWPGKVINEALDGLDDLVAKDMMINVNLNGTWGIFQLEEILTDEEVYDKSTSCFVDISKRGDLTSLSWFRSVDFYGDDEEKSEETMGSDGNAGGSARLHENVNTYYSALNFRDILLATGRLTADAYPPNDIETLIGTEFSGITESGRRVMGICHGNGIATRIPGKHISILFDVPDSWSLEEAATIPNAYLTVYYALLVRGGIRKGETVLIHAGSGGVGQAAISLCLARGCKVFTTVSTREKRDFLKSMFHQLAEDSFADSRSTQFEDHILKCTNGRGVDVVLNSLVEDKLQAGLRCLAEGGRFLELGKYDIIQNHNFDPISLSGNSSFQVICLSFVISKICENSWEGRQLGERFAKIFQNGIQNGEIRPIKSHVFEKNQVEDAFRLMAKSRHLGKVLIKIREEQKLGIPLEPIDCICRTYFHPRKCYILVGGLGGMGQEMAYWMVTRGARNLVISTRSGFKSDNERGFVEFLRWYRNRRHNIIVTINDAMSKTMVQQLIESAEKLGPIGGIFNLALVLKDGLFENQTVESFEAVCGPKIQVTHNLDLISRQMCPQLDHFVCFSSIATLGSVGQSNYAFANSFMERVCEERRRDGLPGLAVQWGPVADVGIAARLVSEKDLVIFGFAAQNIFSCFRALDKFMQLPDAVCQSCVLSSGTHQETPLFENIFQRMAHILGIKDIDALDPNTTLNELGLDSLQSSEVREYFGRQYNISLDDKPLGSLKISDIRDLSKKFKPQEELREETLD